MPATSTPTIELTEYAPRLRTAVGRVWRRLRPTASATAAGLTPTRVAVLFHVVREGSVRISDLAAAEGINPTMLSRIVSGLADDGLLARVSDESDRRAVWVKPTAAGKRLAERMRRERTDTLKVALERLSDRERHELERALPALEALAEALKEATGR